jgi:hypothetical protein
MGEFYAGDYVSEARFPNPSRDDIGDAEDARPISIKLSAK